MGNRKPATLGHYTSADGLLGILSSKSFYATDALYLSDASELSHGFRLVEKALSEPPLDRHTGVVASVRNIFKHLNDTMQLPYRVHDVCFCERGDLLSQWRGYGMSGAGYSMGLVTEGLLSSIIDSDTWALYPVDYDEDRQAELVERVALMASNTAAKLSQDLTREYAGEGADDLQREVIEETSFHLLSFLAQMGAA